MISASLYISTTTEMARLKNYVISKLHLTLFSILKQKI